MITRVIEGCVRWVRGVELSDDCLMRRAPGFGAIAQLGERVLCKHEVVGSIPSGSTIFVMRAPRILRVGRRHISVFEETSVPL